MIEFMILAAPRSGTTWAANWLTTDKTLCLHDPLWTWHYDELDSIISKRKLGVSCTGLYMFPKWVNSHQAKKIILHRPLKEINASLEAIGLPSVDEKQYKGLDDIDGLHMEWTAIFSRPWDVYEYLTGLEFDSERHSFLMDIEMQPKFSGLKIGREVTRKLINELQEV